MGKGGGGGIGSQAMDAAAKTFWSSQGARKAMFQQLQSALRTGGGTGFKSGVVHTGIARSIAASRQAVANMGSATTGLDPSVRSRLINRTIQAGKADVASQGPSFAAKLISQAPAAFNSATAGQAGALDVAAGGEAAAREAASIKAQGWSNAASAVASSAGRAFGDWYSKPGGETPPTTPAPTSPAPTPSWYSRFFGNSGVG